VCFVMRYVKSEPAGRDVYFFIIGAGFGRWRVPQNLGVGQKGVTSEDVDIVSLTYCCHALLQRLWYRTPGMRVILLAVSPRGRGMKGLSISCAESQGRSG